MEHRLDEVAEFCKIVALPLCEPGENSGKNRDATLYKRGDEVESSEDAAIWLIKISIHKKEL